MSSPSASNCDYALHRLTDEFVRDMGASSSERDQLAVRIIDTSRTPRTAASSNTDSSALLVAQGLAVNKEAVQARFDRLRELNPSSARAKLAFLTDLRQRPTSVALLADIDSSSVRSVLHTINMTAPSSHTSSSSSTNKPPLPARQTAGISSIGSVASATSRASSAMTMSSNLASVKRSTRQKKTQCQLARDAFLDRADLPMSFCHSSYFYPIDVTPDPRLASTMDDQSARARQYNLWTEEHRELEMCGELIAVLDARTCDYVRASRVGDPMGGPLTYKIDSVLSAEQRHKVAQCLPLAYAVDRIRQYLYSQRNGQSVYSMCNKLSAWIGVNYARALGELSTQRDAAVTDYVARSSAAHLARTNVTTLSTVPFTLDRIIVHMSPFQRLLPCIADTLDRIVADGRIGGGVATLLQDKLDLCASGVGTSIDDRRHAYDMLLKAAMAPLLIQLHEWLHFGRLRADPLRQFFIWPIEQEDDFQADFDLCDWRHRFQLQEELCPAFLLPFAPAIMECGINMLVVQKFVGDDRTDIPSNATISMSDFDGLTHGADIVSRVHRAVQISNRRLLVVMQEHKLDEMQSLIFKTMLLTRCDWLDEFLDGVQTKELTSKTTVSHVHFDPCVEKLRAALRQRVTNDAQMVDRVTLTFQSRLLVDVLKDVLAVSTSGRLESSARTELLSAAPMSDSMPAMDGLCIDVRIDAPLSALFTDNVFQPYKFVFRRLLNARLAQRALQSLHLTLMVIGDRHTSSAPSAVAFRFDVRRLWNVKRLLLTFIVDYACHCQSGIIATSVAVHATECRTAVDLSAIRASLTRMMDCVIDGCLLNDAQLVDVVAQLIKLARDFCAHVVDLFDNANDLGIVTDAANMRLLNVRDVVVKMRPLLATLVHEMDAQSAVVRSTKGVLQIRVAYTERLRSLANHVTALDEMWAADT